MKAKTTEDEWVEIAGERIDPAALDKVYSRRGYAPIWLDEGGQLSGAGKILLSRLEAAGSQGLKPDHYRVRGIHERLAARAGHDDAALELLFSHLLIHYATDIGGGRLEPGRVARALSAFHREISGAEVVERAIAAPDLAAFLDSLAPRSKNYRELQKSLVHYQAMAPWPTLPDGPPLKPEIRDEGLPILKERLRLTGDLAEVLDNDVHEDTLKEAVIRFQARHGLLPDGIVGPATRAALNVPREKRIEQIVLNMERLRWLPDDLGPRYVRVNIAGFAMDLFEEERSVLTMRVVVGRTYRRTPVFVSEIESIDLNPNWTVPPSIAGTDILRHIRAEPDYLVRHNFKVFSSWSPDAKELAPRTVDWAKLGPGRFPYRLRQEPGPDNALGQYKFVFPNSFGVYLHDTPSRSLFSREQRTFSSGCIRLENAQALAEHLLTGETDWSLEKLADAVLTGQRQTIHLTRPVPVLVTYATAWVSEDGAVQFRPDVYGRDARLAAALKTVEETQAPTIRTQ